MDTLSQQDLKDIYESLPDDLQEAIFAPESTDVYNGIMERYALDAAQRQALSIQSGLLMMGITDPKDFIPALSSALGIPRDKAAFIAQEVNRDILNNVKESLKFIHGLAPAPKLTEIPLPTPPAAPVSPSSVPSGVLEGKSLLEQKLGGMFKMPAAPAGQSAVIPPPSQPAPVHPRGDETAPAPADPYREARL